MKRFTADFETSTWLSDESFVWAWAICEIGNVDNLRIGNSIDTFMELVEKENNPIILFHNLKFDGEFILYWLMKNGFLYTEKKERKDRTFSTLISDMGLFYEIEVYFENLGVEIRKINPNFNGQFEAHREQSLPSIKQLLLLLRHKATS